MYQVPNPYGASRLTTLKFSGLCIHSLYGSQPSSIDEFRADPLLRPPKYSPGVSEAMIKLNPRKADPLLYSRYDNTSTGLIVPLSRMTESHPKTAASKRSARWPPFACCAISGCKVYWKHGFAPGLGCYHILDQSANSDAAEGQISGEMSKGSRNNSIMMLSHIYDFWNAGLLAIHPETLRIRCFVPSDVISKYDDKAASFPNSETPDRDCLRLHYEICVWVNMTACLPRVALELPLTTKDWSMFQTVVDASIEKAQKLGVRDATCYGYCTQKCLLGLRYGDMLDEQCPNFARHCVLGAIHGSSHHDASHPLNYDLFTFLIQNQLRIDQVLFCQQPTVSVKGHHAEFFKITLAGFGYTFCTKGVALSDQHRLMNEYIMYQRMKAIQGVCVPVCLGLFALQVPFGSHNISGLEITHVLLMSNAGASVEENGSKAETCDVPSEDILELESNRTLKAIRSAGIDRHDRRKKHLYWNTERKRVFYIDFEKNHLMTEVDIADSSSLEGSESSTEIDGWLTV